MLFATLPTVLTIMLITNEVTGRTFSLQSCNLNRPSLCSLWRWHQVKMLTGQSSVHRCSVMTQAVSFFLGWHAHGDQEVALQLCSQPQTDGDYWFCCHDGQRGIKKVRENVQRWIQYDLRQPGVGKGGRKALPSSTGTSWSQPLTELLPENCNVWCCWLLSTAVCCKSWRHPLNFLLVLIHEGLE